MVASYRKRKRPTLSQIMKKSWWVLFVLAVFFLGFTSAITKKNHQLVDLQNRLSSLEEEKMLVMNEQEELSLKMNSQSDPDWVEMILMRELGLVPKGKLKVHFAKDE